MRTWWCGRLCGASAHGAGPPSRQPWPLRSRTSVRCACRRTLAASGRLREAVAVQRRALALTMEVGGERMINLERLRLARLYLDCGEPPLAIQSREHLLKVARVGCSRAVRT